MYSANFEAVLAQKSRAEHCCYSGNVFQEGRAQKSRQRVGIFSLVEISCILTENDCPDIFLEEIIRTLSLTGFPLVGFSRAFGQKFLSSVCCLKVHLFYFLS